MTDMLVLTLDGDIDIAAKARIARELLSLESFEANSAVVVDISNVSFVDTTFINALWHTRKQLAYNRTTIVIVSPLQSYARRLFALAGLMQTFPFLESVSAARAMHDPRTRNVPGTIQTTSRVVG